MRSDCKARMTAAQPRSALAPLRDERWAKHRASVEKWKLANYEYYIFQKRRLAARPAYLAHRRACYRAKRSKPEQMDLSTIQNSLNDIETTDEGADRPPDPARGAAAGA